MAADIGILGKLKKRDVDMTEGDIKSQIIAFSLPLLIGNIFQQLYNMVDTWVVGTYVSNEAFAAVGSVGPIINMLIGFFMGLSSGAGVVISQYYGARQHDKVKKTVHTAMVMTFIMAIIFTIIGVSMTPFMLKFMKTDPEVFPESKAYLTIYFAGVIGLMVYNMGCGILKAVGDSNRPFYYLVVSAVINTVLDLLFVIKFNMGVSGVAYATIIAQGISAILVTVALIRSDTAVKLTLKDLKISFDMLSKIIRIGIPAAIQMAITAFSNVFVQSYINYFGADTMSGWTAYSKIDSLMFLPMQSISIAATTFVGQNLGRGQVERAKKGVRCSLIMGFASTAIIMIPVMIFSPQLVQFFNKKETVIACGSILLKYITPFYMVCVINQVLSGALRGAGNSKAPMIIMLLSFVAFRQAYLFIMANYVVNEIIPIAMGYPAGWLLCSILTFVYYKKTNLKNDTVV